MTSNLEQRVYQHKNKLIDGFTRNYKIDKLVYFEACDTAEQATNREQQLKKWRRSWKLELIESENPEWDDLAKSLFDWIPNQARDDGTGEST